MEKEIMNIGGRECISYSSTTESDMLLVQLVDEHDLETMDNELETISKLTGQPFNMVAVKVKDWQSELTPWTAPAVFGKVPFGDCAGQTLAFLVNMLLPSMNANRVLLGGYSLAGLFALWASYNSNLFNGIAAASPSVWYPRWVDYAERHVPQTPAIYLSLGDKEEKTKNAVMARVGDCIRNQHGLLQKHNIHTCLEWNEGNHFRDADIRMAKGFAWLMNNI